MCIRNCASAIKTARCQTVTKIRVFRFLLIVFAFLLAACAKPPQMQVEFALGTICEINLFEGGNDQLYSRIFARINEIDRTMSAFSGEYQDIGGGIASNALVDPGSREAAAIQSVTEALVSGVVAINENAGVEPVKVRADLIHVLERALHYAELSDGAFDPTVGPLVRLWGIGSEKQRIPYNDEIEAALDLVGWRDLVIDREAGTAFLRRKGMALDLGAIAKGYAADEAVRLAGEGKVKRAIINLGGNIVAMGWRDSKKSLPWRIGVQDPLHERGSYIGVLMVNDASVVTSGVYERFFEEGGRRYHHLLSTADGYPVDNGLSSVTIITEKSIEADALSTVAFTLGFEKGSEIINSIPGIEAVFVFHDGRVHVTGNRGEFFKLTNDDFVIF